jgi:uncharacterized membrane protein
MGLAREVAHVDAPPDRALAAWTDLERWPAFVEAFRSVIRADHAWPAAGTEVVWETSPHGRGRVTERVETHEPPGEGTGRLATRVSDPSLNGIQTVTFAPEDGGTRVEIALDYALAGAGVLEPLVDRLFIRRALRASLERTLERFAAEAARII